MFKLYLHSSWVLGLAYSVFRIQSYRAVDTQCATIADLLLTLAVCVALVGQSALLHTLHRFVEDDRAFKEDLARKLRM